MKGESAHGNYCKYIEIQYVCSNFAKKLIHDSIILQYGEFINKNAPLL